MGLKGYKKTGPQQKPRTCLRFELKCKQTEGFEPENTEKVCLPKRLANIFQRLADAQALRLRFWSGFAKTEDPVSDLELAALGEKLDAFKALEDVAFSGNCTGPFEAAMLGHKM